MQWSAVLSLPQVKGDAKARDLRTSDSGLMVHSGESGRRSVAFSKTWSCCVADNGDKCGGGSVNCIALTRHEGMRASYCII